MRSTLMLLIVWVASVLSSESCFQYNTLDCSVEATVPCRDVQRERSGVSGSCYDASNNLTLEYKPTFYSQPSVILKDFTLNKNQTRSGDFTETSSIMVGYRDCQSHPSQMCFLNLEGQIPSDITRKCYELSFSTIISSQQLTPGDTCTFFGCYLYVDSRTDKCFQRDFFVENVTILGTCPDPGNFVENGSLSFHPSLYDTGKYLEETVVYVECDEGFVASTNASECQTNGSWIPELPKCIRECPMLDQEILSGPDSYIVNYTIPTVSRFLVNSTIEIVCRPYSTDKGNNIITCKEDGNWTEQIPQCELITCLKLDDDDGALHGGIIEKVISPKSSSLPEGKYLATTNITVKCHPFHHGHGFITCDANGKWSLMHFQKCSPDDKAVFSLVAVLILVVLAVLVLVLVISCKKYCNYRNDELRRLKLTFSMQARREVLNPYYEPIDLHRHKKVEISLSIQTLKYDIDSTTNLSPLMRNERENEVQQTDAAKPHSRVEKPEEFAGVSKILALTSNTSYPACVHGGNSRSCPSFQEENTAAPGQPINSSRYHSRKSVHVSLNNSVTHSVPHIDFTGSNPEVQSTNVQSNRLSLPGTNPRNSNSSPGVEQPMSPSSSLSLNDVTGAFATVDTKSHDNYISDSANNDKSQQKGSRPGYVNSEYSKSDGGVYPGSSGYVYESGIALGVSHRLNYVIPSTQEDDSELSSNYANSDSLPYTHSEYLTESDLSTTVPASIHQQPLSVKHRPPGQGQTHTHALGPSPGYVTPED